MNDSLNTLRYDPCRHPSGLRLLLCPQRRCTHDRIHVVDMRRKLRLRVGQSKNKQEGCGMIHRQKRITELTKRVIEAEELQEVYRKALCRICKRIEDFRRSAPRLEASNELREIYKIARGHYE